MPTLFLWGALDPTPAAAADESVPVALPTLDPPSLYAASLLRLLPAHEQHTLTLATPSALLHATVPRLEFSDSHAYAARTDALHGIRPIETYARTPNAAQQRPSIDDALRSTPLLSSRATALHAVLTHQLEPITLHALFSHQHNFAALAVPTYTYSPGQKAPSSWGAKVGMVLGAPVQRPKTRSKRGRYATFKTAIFIAHNTVDSIGSIIQQETGAKMATLFLWGALDPTPAVAAAAAAAAADESVPVALPTLDPPSLYAASLLRLLPAHEQHTLTLATPSALLHATVPRLEFSDSRAYAARTDALHGIRPIETYARTPNAAQQRPSIDDALRSTPLLSSRATALHAVLTHQLEPITLHALFSHQDNFAALAVPTYTYSPGQKTPSSWGAKVGMVLGAPVQVRPRLRASVQAQLGRRGIWGLAGSPEEERERETRTRKGRRLGKPPAGGKQDGPARVRAGEKDAKIGLKGRRLGIPPAGGKQDGPARVRTGEKDAKIGLKGSSRKEIVIGWERAKLTSIAEGSLDVLNAALEQDLNKTSWLLGTSSPTSLDAHLFSVIAPVLLLPPRSADKLGASTPMASLLRTQYPALVAHTTRLAQRLWAVQPLTSIAKGSLDVLNATLEQDLNKTSWLLGTSSPTSLDAHLFSVIAPVLLLPPKSADKLGASTPMASLLRTQYPALVAHTTRLAQRLWAVQPVGVEGGPSASASASAAETQWEWKSTETQRIHVARTFASSSSSTPSSVSLSAAAGYLASSALSAPARAWSSMRSYIYPRRAARPPPDSSSSSTASSLLRPENLGWGRIIWISSAVVGVVSFIFVTGLIQIEIVDVDEGEGQEQDDSDADEGGEGGEEEEGDEVEGVNEREIDDEEVLMQESEGDGHQFQEGEQEEGED
ncbi:unnamed protein product [Tilletia laevis]|uniref:Metaxin glutathione S-transferase domain-containing protein n=1 Tax=Tilletia laevis TaxID=157183 RepID=A0A9N8MEF6_9BASI|nr:unnamed protein product [Tilletia laevis]